MDSCCDDAAVWATVPVPASLAAASCSWQPGRRRQEKLQVSRSHQGRHHIAESPLRGTIFKLTPLKKLENIKGNAFFRVDQCQHGALHPVDKPPIKKSTVLAANMRFKVCRGKHGTNTGVHSTFEGYNPNTKLL